MQQVDGEIIAHWRESGRWWMDEPPLEIIQYRDSRGIRREIQRTLSMSGTSPWNQRDYVDVRREEYSLRPRKIRDEKIQRACGFIPEAPKSHPFIENQISTYAPLHVLSGYAFGRSTLFPEEIPRRAAQLGLPAVAITDAFSLVGAVEFAYEAAKFGVKPLIGASFEMPEGGELVLIARDKRGYQSLSQLITACHLDEPRLYPLCTWQRLDQYSRGLLCLTGGDVGPLNRLVISGNFDRASAMVDQLIGIYGHSYVFIEIERCFLPWERTANSRLVDLAEHHGLRCVAAGAVTHAQPDQFPSQDILACAETLCTVDEIIGRKPARHQSQLCIADRPARAINGEQFLRSREDMSALFHDMPHLLVNTLDVVEHCDDDVLPSRTQLPELYPDSAHALREVTFAGAAIRHKKMSSCLKARLNLELERIVRLNFAGHFLTIWDACQWAGEQQILYSGRGSVVDSAVAFCLGLSRIDAHEHGLHFDRFLPEDGSKRPDIDIDFEAKRRDDVRNYLTRKYGEDRVATVAAIGAFCTRGIVREVGKALGLSNEVIGFLAKRIHGGVPPEQLESALEKRPELRNSGIPKERFRWVFRLSEMLADVPRNMRAHSSGVVISDRPLAETVPVMWSASEIDGKAMLESPNLKIIQWDKRSAKHFFDKFDILCLRGQDVLSGTQQRVRVSDLDFKVESIPLDDENSYRAMRSGELIGIPQSASPAMRQAHIRIRTANLHDASLVQAGIRPGVGGAVKINELIERRRGLKPYRFEHPLLEKILGITYGIVVFQEQVDQLLQEFCGYGSGEAEDIRDKIHKRRREDYGQVIKDELIGRVCSRGFTLSIAEHVFSLVAEFKGYGFAQGHALAFAEISIRSIYCQQNYPAPYFAALLSAQPAGYYGPATIANEARVRGVMILPVDVNQSEEAFSVEDVQSQTDPKLVFPAGGIRVGLMQVAGLSKSTRVRILDQAPDLNGLKYTSFFDFVDKVLPEKDELEQLILCGAFDALQPNRRALLWSIPEALSRARTIRQNRDSLDPALSLDHPQPVLAPVEDFNSAEKALHERTVLDLDVAHHLMCFERERVAAKNAITSEEAKHLPDRQKAIVVGNPIRLRFPPTPSGKRVVFFDLEDETGLLNVTCFDAVYRCDGHSIICSPYVTIVGEAQLRDGHTAFLAKRVFPYQPTIRHSISLSEPMPVPTADFLVG